MSQQALDVDVDLLTATQVADEQGNHLKTLARHVREGRITPTRSARRGRGGHGALYSFNSLEALRPPTVGRPSKLTAPFPDKPGSPIPPLDPRDEEKILKANQRTDSPNCCVSQPIRG